MTHWRAQNGHRSRCGGLRVVSSGEGGRVVGRAERQWRSEGSLAAQEQYRRDGRVAILLWLGVTILVGLVLLVGGCTAATYERPDGTRVSYTSLWKDFEGIDAEYVTEQTAATLTVGKSSTHEMTAAEREAVRRAVLNILTGAASPVVP